MRKIYRITLSFLKQYSQPEKIANNSCHQTPAHYSVPLPRVSVPVLWGVHPLYYENSISAVAPELYPLHSYSQHLSANWASPCFAHAWKHRVTSLQASPAVSETTARWQSITACAVSGSGGTRGGACFAALATKSQRSVSPPLKWLKISNNQAAINGALLLYRVNNEVWICLWTRILQQGMANRNAPTALTSLASCWY